MTIDNVIKSESKHSWQVSAGKFLLASFCWRVPYHINDITAYHAAQIIRTKVG
jgi:hypothetical protein